MNSTINYKSRTYRDETLGDKIVGAGTSVLCAVLTFFDVMFEFLTRPVVSFFVKSATLACALVIILGAAGGIEAGTVTFASAAIRILATTAASFLVFKGVSE